MRGYFGDDGDGRFVDAPPHPKFKLCLNFDLSPQAGRGEPDGTDLRSLQRLRAQLTSTT